MEQEKDKRSIMPGPYPPPPYPPPPPYNEMHHMGIRLVQMGLEMLQNCEPIYPEPYYETQNDGLAKAEEGDSA